MMNLLQVKQVKCIFCKNKYPTYSSTKVCSITCGPHNESPYPSLFIDHPLDESKFKRADLTLIQCPSCSFVQLQNQLPADSMYREYWYRSGLNNSMIASLKDVVDKTLSKSEIRYESFMDIGCNDGTLLSFYKDRHPHALRVGYDPANNLAKRAIEHCDIFVNDYFNKNIHYKYPFDIITAIAMFYDVPEPDKFLLAIRDYLAPKGICVIQMTDLTSMLKVNAFDNICHEHIAYYTLQQLSNLATQCGLEVFDVEYNDVNGGSLRAYIAHEDMHKISPNVVKALEQEQKILADRNWDEFSRIANAIVTSVRSFIIDEVKNGKIVYGLGASTKGNTFLQAADLTGEHIPYVLEVSNDKLNKYTLGSNCKIVPQPTNYPFSFYKDYIYKPDYLLALPWHFTEFFLKQDWMLDYLKTGGKLIVPMPEPGIWSWSNEGPMFTSLDSSVKVWNE